MDLEGQCAQSPSIGSSVFVSILIALTAFCLVFIWKSGFYYEGEFYFSLFDDAMISMTYARNLASGAGLVWNPGEPPVEGYTNFLWVLWMALIHALPIPESKTSGAVMLTGVAVLVANLIVLRELAHRLLRSPIIRSYAIAAVAFSYPLLYWTLRGTEVGLQALIFGLCLLAALHHIEYRDRRALVGFAIFTSLGFLVRPDFALPAGGVALIMLAHRPAHSWPRFVLILGLITGITFVGLTTFRYVYFGDVVPNTYYLKIAGAHRAFKRRIRNVRYSMGTMSNRAGCGRKAAPVRGQSRGIPRSPTSTGNSPSGSTRSV